MTLKEIERCGLPAAELALRWREVCDEQDALREALKSCRSPRELLSLLAERFQGEWAGKRDAYDAAHSTISSLRQRTGALEREIAALREEARAATDEATKIEQAKGDNYRSDVKPIRERLFDIKENQARRLSDVQLDAATGKPRKQSKEERAATATQLENEAREIEELRAQIAAREAERASFDEEINALRNRARQLRTLSKTKVREKLNLERSPEVAEARTALRHLRYEAELERLRRTRDAIITTGSLRYTNNRPTAWWLPLVSPDGRWFDRLARTAQARVEEI